MARYECRTVGVYDRELAREITPADGPVWQDYELFLYNHGVPDPQPPDPPPPPLPLSAYTDRVNAIRDTQIQTGVMYNGHAWDTDDLSRSNIVGTVSAINAGIPLPVGFVWRTQDNQNIQMAAADMVGLGAAVLQYVNSVYGYSWQLKAQLAAAADPSTIDVTAGWPSNGLPAVAGLLM